MAGRAGTTKREEFITTVCSSSHRVRVTPAGYHKGKPLYGTAGEWCNKPTGRLNRCGLKVVRIHKHERRGTRMSEQEFRRRSQSLVLGLTLAKDEALRIGLWRTMHKLDEATRQIGYEIGDVLEGRQVWPSV